MRYWTRWHGSRHPSAGELVPSVSIANPEEDRHVGAERALFFAPGAVDGVIDLGQGLTATAATSAFRFGIPAAWLGWGAA